MPKVQRTPPSLKNNANSQTQSVPDISTAVEMSDHVTSRRPDKRPRSECSPENVCLSNNPSLEDNPETWKKDQNTLMSKKLEEQTTLMAKLVADVGEIKAQNTKIQETNSEIRKTSVLIEQSISFMNAKFEELKKEVEDLKKDRQHQQNFFF
ncbi:hypothetical protein PYW08_010501 [Mythimna loreyi]|uniref:Uncharacterized protein n=1 Tax=Mythimna loreyi TaxID=667449 RepID=A0ACC2Q5C0_9NEOP|nr:hypothetical protein PYW08_010501 [Mythimna loreyi]